MALWLIVVVTWLLLVVVVRQNRNLAIDVGRLQADMDSLFGILHRAAGSKGGAAE
jgi:hypothetical protein